MIKNVESHTGTYFPSDHFPLELRLKMKLSKHRGRPPDKSNAWKNPQKLTWETQQKFNEQIQEIYKEWAPDKESEDKTEMDQTVAALRYALEEAAEENRLKKNTEIARPNKIDITRKSL